MSGLSSTGRNGQTEQFGGAFLFKPFKIQALLSTVANLLHPAPVVQVT